MCADKMKLAEYVLRRRRTTISPWVKELLSKPGTRSIVRKASMGS